ncbi:MAG TPA: alkene reductase [Actinophytocola sp.]|jgi:N-ethylmaleimide reductase|uniref:alkene reductase n=1 Tax=Actinophytocola sp. TaxID=1872138 RepID=UPI002F921C74
MSTLFEPTKAGKLNLANRLVMAPMSRNRATPAGVVTPLVAEYYAQRATAGLIIAEASQPSALGQGYPCTPGLYTDEQIEAWATVTDAVHQRGGSIFAQVMHAGRISHPDNTGGRTPVGPSAVKPAGGIFTPNGFQEFVTPRELTVAEIKEIVADHGAAARRAIEGGFDGIELHGHSGFLVHEFIGSNSNLRTDQYGGSVANRIRLAVEIVGALAEAAGPERVSVRIGPGFSLNDVVETDTEEHYAALLSELDSIGVEYLHLLVGDVAGPVLASVRSQWDRTLIVNQEGSAGRSATDVLEGATVAVDNGADLVSIGAAFLANPDLVRRLRIGAELNTPIVEHFYGGTEVGYTDYPELDAGLDAAA